MKHIILGAIQGITEWLPVSSQGVITIISQAMGGDMSINMLNKYILLLHFGTFLAALVYFRKDIYLLLMNLTIKERPIADKKLFNFLFISTMISGLLGLGLQQLLKKYLMIAHKYQFAGPALMIAIGVLLIITAIMQLTIKSMGKRSTDNITLTDSIILGITQGFAALPGISRSGSTVSLLLLRGFDKKVALKISFLMSLPIVLVGNILLNISSFALIADAWPGVIMSFIFGLLTIHGLLTLAEKINFGFFVLGFGILTIASAFI